MKTNRTSKFLPLFLHYIYLLIVLDVLEEFINLRNEVELVKENVNYMRVDVEIYTMKTNWTSKFLPLFLHYIYLLIVLDVLEEFINLRNEVELVKENVNYMRVDVANKTEAVKDTKKVEDAKEIKNLTQTISITNGEFYVIGFCIVLKVSWTQVA